MEKIRKFRKIFDITLTLSLIVGYFYVQSALKTNNVPVKEVKKDNEKTVDIKPAHPQLVLEINGTQHIYNATMRNSETVEDFLSRLVDEKSISFEKIGYRYGTEIDLVNGVQAPEGMRWAIFKGNKDITYVIGDENLNSKSEIDTYTMKLVADIPQ